MYLSLSSFCPETAVICLGHFFKIYSEFSFENGDSRYHLHRQEYQRSLNYEVTDLEVALQLSNDVLNSVIFWEAGKTASRTADKCCLTLPPWDTAHWFWWRFGCPVRSWRNTLIRPPRAYTGSVEALDNHSPCPSRLSLTQLHFHFPNLVLSGSCYLQKLRLLNRGWPVNQEYSVEMLKMTVAIIFEPRLYIILQWLD